MRKWLSVFIFIVFFSCTSETEEGTKVDGLKEKIMAGHDVVMPKMGLVKQLEIAIIDLPDSLKSKNDSLLIVQQDLANSNNWMNQWMREYDVTSQDESYLSDQLDQIEKMKSYINKSISNAEKVLSISSK